jgi:hypothetical protein
MKLLIALALAAAPSALAMAPYVPSTDEPTPMTKATPRNRARGGRLSEHVRMPLFDGACRLALEAAAPRSRHIKWSKV